MLTPQEIELRLPMWCALSELFVDTEFDDAMAQDVASRLRATGLAVQEIGRILLDEVAPVFHRNVFVGNWTGWQRDDVRQMVADHLMARERQVLPKLLSPLRQFVRRLQLSGTDASWQRVKVLLSTGTATRS